MICRLEGVDTYELELDLEGHELGSTGLQLEDGVGDDLTCGDEHKLEDDFIG